ncbi:MAG: (Fe-S)-binding protein [Candidatus Helarchaeota archaeon]
MHIEKYIEDIYTCNRSRCGFCREECPTFGEFRFEAYSCRGRIQIARGIIEKKVQFSKNLLEAINICTTCGYCEYKCALHNVEIIEALRADLIENGFRNRDHEKAKNFILKSGNPINQPRSSRAKWAENLEFDNNSSELFFAGCIYSYMYPERLKKMITILNKLGIKFNYLGEEENCCGDLLYTTGYWNEFNQLKIENEKLFKSKNIKKIITPCPGCAKTLLKTYSEQSNKKSEFEVVHIIQYLDQLIQEGKLRFKKETNLKVTWHDPCDLSRHLKIIEEPRRILNSIPSLKLIEMEHNKYNSKCCGAGGGMLNAYADISMDIAEKRLREAEQTGADYIVTSCPTCESTFEKIIRYEDSEMKILNIFELIEMVI